MFERRGLLQAAVCVVVTLAVVFLVASSGMAATYYISTTGDDDNDGSWDYPWRHIAKANSTLVAGDTVYVLAGTYPEPIDAANSGNAISGYISYIGYEDDVILDGSSLGSGSGVYFWDTSYIHVENFQIHDWFREGVHALVADHIRLVDCLVDQCGKRADDWDMGVELDTVTDFVVDGCDLIDNLICGILVIESQDGRIANTWADDNNGTGRRGARVDDADGFLIQNSQHILIENCIASWNGEDGFDAGLYEGWSGDTTDIVMRDCLSYENGSAGYNMSGADDPYPYATYDIKMIRCRGYENYKYGIVWYQQATGIWVSNTTLADENGGIRDGWTPNNGFDLKFKNSNVAFHKYSKFDGEGPFLLDYNNWYESLPQGGAGSNYLNEDPLFEDRENYDHRLTSESPLIDAGGPLTLTTSAGSGTTIPVDASGYFTDGCGVGTGDTIRVGSSEATIVNISSSTSITVDSSISWDSGDWVSFPYSGEAPDMGCYEFVGGTSHVGAIDLVGEYQGGGPPSGRGYYAEATITVHDQNCDTLSGVTVDITWSGCVSATDSDVTDGNGQVLFTSPVDAEGGTFQCCVDDLTKGGYPYESGDNHETCDDIQNP